MDLFGRGEAYFFPAFGLLIVGKEAPGNQKSHRISHKNWEQDLIFPAGRMEVTLQSSYQLANY